MSLPPLAQVHLPPHQGRPVGLAGERAMDRDDKGGARRSGRHRHRAAHHHGTAQLSRHVPHWDSRHEVSGSWTGFGDCCLCCYWWSWYRWLGMMIRIVIMIMMGERERERKWERGRERWMESEEYLFFRGISRGPAHNNDNKNNK